MTRFWVVLVGLAWCSAPGYAREGGPEWPQVKVDRVDASDPARWRIFVTALGEGGRAIPIIERGLEVFLARGNEAVAPHSSSPLTRFDGDVAAKGFSGKVRAIGKSEVPQAVAIVVASHSDVPPEVREVLPKVLATLLKGLRKDARVTVILYGDVVQVLWSPDGQRGEWRDLNEYHECLGRLRREATGNGGDAAGVPCGRLVETPETVAGWVQSLPPGQGLFPRLFGIREAEEVVKEAERRGHSVLERRRTDEPFATGAVEAAARLLILGSDPEAERLVLLLSDGRDGYLRVAGLASERVSRSPECTRAAKACTMRPGPAVGGGPRPKGARAISTQDHEGGSPECVRQTLECALPKVARALRRREEVVGEYLALLVQRLRAAGVRVHAIALPGTDEVGAGRLKALALKTGGTYRATQNVALLEKGAPEALADELKSQVVVSPPGSLDPGQGYSVAVALTGPDRLVSAPYRFRAGTRVLFFERPLSRARAWVLSRLGHTWGPPVFWTALVLGALMVLALAWTFGKAVVGLGKRLVKGGKPPKAPGGFKVPTLKRPDR